VIFDPAIKIWNAPAKLNLFLHITARREDGFHDLQTIFQFIDFCDQLQFKTRRDSQIIRHYNAPLIEAENDLIVRAAKLLQQNGKNNRSKTTGLDIYLSKKLPMGGGVGGGSSDAATTLVALNNLWQLNLSENELAHLGLQLGADVPVFVHGQAVWAEGVGERFTAIEIPEPWYVVIIPEVHVSTAELFSHPELRRDMPLISLSDYKPGSGENVFETLVRHDYPAVDVALKWLNNYAPSRMTGTGSCVYAPFDSEAQALNCLNQLPEQMKGFVAKGRNISPLYEN